MTFKWKLNCFLSSRQICMNYLLQQLRAILGKFLIYDMHKIFSPISVSKAKILGNPELFIKSGSDINLTCMASQISSPPSFIYWYKGSRVVNYSQRGGINVMTDRNTKTSKLVISKAEPGDSGNYTCSPSNSGESFDGAVLKSFPKAL